MQYSNLSDREFRHYHELYNMDPVVQRLCQMTYYDEVEQDLESQVADLEDEVSILSSTNEELEITVEELEDKIRVLEEKIAVWETLEKE